MKFVVYSTKHRSEVRVDQSVVFCEECCRFYKAPEWGSCSTQKTTDWSTRTSLRCFVEPSTHFTENYWLINTNLTQVLCAIYNTLHRKLQVRVDESVVFCVVYCRFYKAPEWGSWWSISSFLWSVLYILINTNLTQVLCRIYNTLHRKRLINQHEPHSGAL
jgi:hypothetical protein